MRAAYQYLAQFIGEVNSVNPNASGPYDFLYIGRVPSVALSDAAVYTRPARIEGMDACETIKMTYRAAPARPHPLPPPQPPRPAAAGEQQQ